MGPIAIRSVNLNRKFLADQADVSLELSSPGAPELIAALRSSTDPIPPGELVLGNAKASAGGTGTIALGGADGKVTLAGHAEAAFSVGIYDCGGGQAPQPTGKTLRTCGSRLRCRPS